MTGETDRASGPARDVAGASPSADGAVGARDGAPPGRARLADVAAAAGVSKATASRALADSPLVNERTRARVWEAAQRLRFEPNRLARSLRGGTSMAVGVVIPDVGTPFYAAALKGAQEELMAAGYHVLVLNTARAAGQERAAAQRLRALQVDALIVATSGGYEDVGVPAVFFDDVPADAAATGVALDNAGGIEQLVRHLADVHGHRRIAYLGPPADVGIGASQPVAGAGPERIEAFKAALRSAGRTLPDAYLQTTDVLMSEASIQERAAALLALEEPPSALVAGTDAIAVGVLREARARGLRVPEDLALVCFDEPVYADLLDPPVTSLDRHDAELGRRAAALLLARLRGDVPAPAISRVAMALVVRRSCGCGAAGRPA